MKKIVFLFVLLVFPVLLATQASAQTQAVTTSTDRALYNLKESVSELVAAKDKDDKNSLAYRIVAFKQVIDLSLAEAEEVRVRLAAVVPQASERVFYDTTIKNLGASVTYFKEARKSFNSLQVKNIEEIKSVAEKFKAWRDINYVPAVEGATDYIALKDAANALSDASTRRDKIEADLDAIPVLTSPSRARAVGELSNLLIKSRDVIAAGVAMERQAYAQFSAKYLATAATSTASTTATGSLSAVTLVSTSSASSSPVLEESTTTASTTAGKATSTASSSVMITAVFSTTTSSSTAISPVSGPALTGTGVEILSVSIKDLVRRSLANVQETYQIFIEMSGVVRTLL